MLLFIDKIDEIKFLGVKLINLEDFIELLVRGSFNLFLLYVIVHLIYSRNSDKKEFYFSFLAVGTVVFMLCFLLSNVKLGLGFALGLFAIFGIIRYRTDTIPIKEMTYLFVIIGISVMNALANKKVSYIEIIVTNLVIILGLYFLEKNLKMKSKSGSKSESESSLKIIYGNMENFNGNKKEELLKDLKQQTGMAIVRYKIEKIDLLNKNAIITVYYKK